MKPECLDCPFRLWPVLCHAAESGHARYCDHVRANHPYFAPLVEAKTLGLPLPSQPRTASISPEAASARLVMLTLRERRACPAFTPHSECGCSGECGREDRPLNPSVDECRHCMRADA